MLVLNATYEPINVCTVRRATVLLLKSKAEVIEIGTRVFTGPPARWPVVIRLMTYVKIARQQHKRKITAAQSRGARRLGCASTAALARVPWTT